tara:strand:+ start:840 stop:1742 length:903 start_codon:yes stop_codon:yes gene_type:complete
MKALFLFILSISFSVIAQKSFIQNGSFENNGNLNIPSGYCLKMAEFVEFWSSYSYYTFEVTKRNCFMSKKDRSVCFLQCPIDTAFIRKTKQNCIEIEQGKYAARFDAFNIEHPSNPTNTNMFSNISYIYNELYKYRKVGIYVLEFKAVITNGSMNNPFFNYLYQEARNNIQQRIEIIKQNALNQGNNTQLSLKDTINEIPEWWDCEPKEENMLRTTILFTNTLPEGKLYQPKDTDLYIDTLLQTDCTKGWNNYTFKFDLKERYKYFIIGYLPRKERGKEKLCPGGLSFALDDFSLTYSRE